MENLKQQERIINLGKLLVKELGLNDSNDTLSRWMAHYVAEKITLVEDLSNGKEKEDAQKVCFDAILNLWQNRWKYPPGKRPLENFEPIFKVLEKINPEKDDTFFFKHSSHLFDGNEDDIDLKEKNRYLTMITQIDKVSRIWIDFLLHQATLIANNNKTETLLESVKDIAEDYDIETIYALILDDKGSKEEYSQETLHKRIKQLEHFSRLNEFILEQYRKAYSDTKD